MSASGNKPPLIFERSFWYFSLSFLTLMLALLVGPRVSDDQQYENCVFNVYLPRPFGVSLNCDSPGFIVLAQDPSRLLDRFNARQSRPGLIVAAAVLAWPLSPLTGMLNKLSATAAKFDIDQNRIPEYLAYILLNIGILLAAFYYLRRICAPWADDNALTAIILSSIGFLLAVNDGVKAFAWSPHTQMFNILAPVFCLYVSLRANAGALLQRYFTISVGFMTGLGFTAYPLFVILLPCVTICSLTFAFRKACRAVWSQTIIHIVLFMLLVLAPEGLWAAFVLLKTGAFYNHEIEAYNEVVWMFQTWRQGFATFLISWLDKLNQLLWFAAVQAVPAVVVLIGVIASSRKMDADEKRPPLWPLISTSILVSAVTAAFYACVGMLEPRLAYSIVPPLIVVVAVAAVAISDCDIRRRKNITYWSVAVVTAWAIYTVVKDGPYS